MKKKTIEEAVIGLSQLIKDDPEFFIQKSKEQTAVEWLWNLSKQRELDKFDLEQAKEMEKQQIIDAWIATDNELQRLSAEQYYNETYNK